MQMHSPDDNLWAACDGQENRKCATQCYARYFSGADEEREQDIAYWESWVDRRMTHVRSVVEQVDLFISPAQYLKQRYEHDFGLPAAKSVYLDYEFDRSRMAGRQRIAGEPFTFGYIGTHIPAKGIHQLIQAFGSIKGDCQLRIWGRDRGQDSRALRAITETLPADKRARVLWMPEYKNQQIAQDVFSHTDVIVTPSVWVENSPLVIHEAQQSRVPVITADAGGMSEYVQHEVNGLLYPHRDIAGLATQMQRLLHDPAFARELGARGYLFSENGEIPAIDQHIVDLEALYQRVLP
jgi:glycosyltransferase involved in cell wall biosynthesis